VTTSVASRSDLRGRVAATIGATLRVNPVRIGPFDSFASLGMDSLAAVELTAAIEDELGIELSLSAVHEHPSLDALCRFIEGDGAEEVRERELARVRQDAVLPPDIVPAHERGPRTRDARRILLTGATGFLGAHLLRTLIDETEATVHCLVRPGVGDGLERVRRNLAAYRLWSDSDAARVRVVRGDLCRPRLGLDAREFRELADEIDAIVHAAADVNWVHGYESLRDANVLGTREILRLACDGTPKPLHFVSSTSVCHSTIGPTSVDENADVCAGVDGLWLGYAKTKCVAESLVREAGARGLPVTIVRPSLITGDASRGGRSNIDDLTSRFIAGCIRMRAAPDLDWRMDCVPADDASRAIVRLALAHEGGTGTHHVASARPRHWRECVLWMRLSGYDVELVPYAEWAEKLRVGEDVSHPLYALRSFFLRRVSGEPELTLPELFEESRRSRVESTRSTRALGALGATIRDVDSRLLSRYFDDFVRRGIVPDVGSSGIASQPPADSREVIEPSEALRKGLDELLGERVRVGRISLAPLESEESIVAELTAWRSRGGTQSGLFHASVETTGEDGSSRDVRLFVKAKSRDTQSIDVAVALAGLASPTLREQVHRFRDHLGLSRSHLRELAIYQLDDAGIRAHSPRPVLIERDDPRRRWVVVLESIADAVMINANDPARWDDESIDAALTGLASIHSRWLGRTPELMRQPWLVPRDESKWIEMAPLWRELARHAHTRSPAFAVPRLRRIHDQLTESVASWAGVLGSMPQTLIHNDFNPRNLALRRDSGRLRLCAFDWELATIGMPQRDLAEFLSFILPPDASPRRIARWVERYRALLVAASGVAFLRTEWETGFRAALCELLVDRLSFYAMIDRVRSQVFLSRVVQSWLNIYGCTAGRV
jgi:thioester reductase-like protein